MLVDLSQAARLRGRRQRRRRSAKSEPSVRALAQLLNEHPDYVVARRGAAQRRFGEGRARRAQQLVFARERAPQADAPRRGRGEHRLVRGAQGTRSRARQRRVPRAHGRRRNAATPTGRPNRNPRPAQTESAQRAASDSGADEAGLSSRPRSLARYSRRCIGVRSVRVAPRAETHGAGAIPKARLGLDAARAFALGRERRIESAPSSDSPSSSETALELLARTLDLNGAARNGRERLAATRALAPHAKSQVVRTALIRSLSAPSALERSDPKLALARDNRRARARSKRRTARRSRRSVKRSGSQGAARRRHFRPLRAYPPADPSPTLVTRGAVTATLRRLPRRA